MGAFSNALYDARGEGRRWTATGEGYIKFCGRSAEGIRDAARGQGDRGGSASTGWERGQPSKIFYCERDGSVFRVVVLCVRR